MPSFGLPNARAEASRRNGAKSRSLRTPEGKARLSQDALKHSFRAQTFMVVGDEDPQEFAALEAALIEELAAEGALQGCLRSGSLQLGGSSAPSTTTRSIAAASSSSRLHTLR